MYQWYVHLYTKRSLFIAKQFDTVTSTITTFIGYNMKANVNHISKYDTSQKGHDVQKHLKKNQ